VSPLPSRSRAGREVLVFAASVLSNERKHIPLQIVVGALDDASDELSSHDSHHQQPMLTLAMSYLNTRASNRRVTVVQRIYITRSAVTCMFIDLLVRILCLRD
jgi:hypothetical protein